MKEIQKKGKRIIQAENIVKKMEGYNLNPGQEKIIRYLVVNGSINNEQCQKLCGSIRRTATRDLSSLVKKGLLVKKGEFKGAYYILSTTTLRI